MKLRTTALRLVPAAALMLLNAACSMETVSSKDVNPEAVYQDYSMTYKEDSGSTHISAQFRVGGWSGTTIELEAPAELKVNGAPVSKSTLFGTRYEKSTGGFVRTVVFEYKTADGKVLTNSISIDPLYLRQAPAVASAHAPYVVELDAPALGSGESVSAELFQESRDAHDRIEYRTARATYNSGRAVFPVAELKKLANGMAKLRLSRSKRQGLAQATREGGGISASYVLREVSVSITGL